MVDKQLTSALSKQAERLADIEESSKKRHGFEFAERDQRIRDLEQLNLKLISAGESMVKMTKAALDGPNSDLAKIKEDVSALLKTSSEAFDSMSKALSLSTSSILEELKT